MDEKNSVAVGKAETQSPDKTVPLITTSFVPIKGRPDLPIRPNPDPGGNNWTGSNGQGKPMSTTEEDTDEKTQTASESRRKKYISELLKKR